MTVQDSINSQTEERKPLIATWKVVVGVLLLLLLVGATIFGLLWLAQNQAPTMEAMRDVLIIALALESCLFGITLIILLIMVIRLVNMLEFEVKPILEKTNETVGTIQGTTTFVSQNVVRPVTRATGFVNGVRRGIQVLFGDPSKNLRDSVEEVSK